LIARRKLKEGIEKSVDVYYRTAGNGGKKRNPNQEERKGLIALNHGSAWGKKKTFKRERRKGDLMNKSRPRKRGKKG